MTSRTKPTLAVSPSAVFPPAAAGGDIGATEDVTVGKDAAAGGGTPPRGRLLVLVWCG